MKFKTKNLYSNELVIQKKHCIDKPLYAVGWFVGNEFVIGKYDNIKMIFENIEEAKACALKWHERENIIMRVNHALWDSKGWELVE